jgi:hypothetical protein
MNINKGKCLTEKLGVINPLLLIHFPLYTSYEKPTAQTAHLVFPTAKANAIKTKRAVFCQR